MILPVFVLDSHEAWRPVGVDESLAQVRPLLRGGSLDGQTCDHPSRLAQDATRLDFPRQINHLALRRSPRVVYSRIVPGADLFWSQFWLWYVYNPWSVAGVGRHEGDWEFVQLGCIDAAGNIPVLATASQHHSGGKREWWTVEKDREGRPVFYVAWGSHAHYFAPGSQGGGLDHCDAAGERIESYEVRPLSEPWVSWRGRWGNSTGEGKSPESPGRQGHRWGAPHLFHSAAK